MQSQTGESDCGNDFGPITALAVSVYPQRSDGQKIFHAAGDDGEALRQTLRRRRRLSVTDIQHFTEEYKPGLTV